MTRPTNFVRRLAARLVVAGCVIAAVASVTPSGVRAVDASDYMPINPQRVLDTRDNGAPLAAGTVLTLALAGHTRISIGAVAAAVNVVAVQPAADGFVTIWPCDTARPNASALNFRKGITRANMSIAKFSPTGEFCLYVSARTHIVIDAAGYFPAGTTYQPLTPARLADTRPGMSTVDGQGAGAGAGHEWRVQVAGRGGVPAGAAAATVNVAVTGASGDGFVTAYPCVARPLAATLNYRQGDTVANSAIIQLDSSGAMCLYSYAVTDVVVDVTGWFPAGTITPVVPARLADTRTGDGGSTRLAAGAQIRVQVAGAAGLPAYVNAAVLNVTGVDAAADGFITVAACGAPAGTASLNQQARTNVANLAVTALDSSGAVCIFSNVATDVVVDVTAVFAPSAPPPPGPSAGTLRVVQIQTTCPFFGMSIDSPTTVYANDVALSKSAHGFTGVFYGYLLNIAGGTNPTVVLRNATDTLTIPGGTYSCP